MSNGISLSTLLTVLFVGLKLTGYITWSWLWVLFPVWFPLVVICFIGVSLMLYHVIASKK